MSVKHEWYSLSHIEQADMIGHVSFNLTQGDDHNIELSNIARDTLEAHGVCVDTLAFALDQIEVAWRNFGRGK